MSEPSRTPAVPHSIAYRPEIDGLRAIAVLLVLLFHCGFGVFRGGFIGVDVFFVISGFLITSITITDLRSGKFSFRRFYGRRIRRLLPALLVTVFLSLLIAPFILAPEHLVDAAESGVLAAVSLSNFYFAKSAGYFDISAQSKPFLHMWSLSLEEQFYLFWPAILFLCHRLNRQRFTPALVMIGIPVGLLISEYWIGKNPTHAYFLLHTRGFQFLMGAACIWLSRVDIRSTVLGHAIWMVGLALILIPAVSYSESTAFPGIAAAIPSLGAMLVIWQSQRSPIHTLLASRVMVWYGRISYATYLVHWPIVVFWLYLAINPLSLTDKVVLLLLSSAAGHLLDSLVAQRFRYPPSAPRVGWRFPVVQASLIVVIAACCGVAIGTHGLPGRFSFVPQVAKYRDESLFPFLRDYRDGVVHIAGRRGGKVLVFGDSMAQNYVPALLQLDGVRDAEVDVVSRGGCVLAARAILVNYGSSDRVCVDLRDRLYRIEKHYDVVIWAQNWLGYSNSLHWESEDGQWTRAFSGESVFGGWRDGVERTVRHFAAQATHVVVIGPPLTVDNVNPIISRIGPATDIAGIAAQLDSMRESTSDGRELMGQGIRALVTRMPNAIYIDPRAVLCEDQCDLSSGGVSYFLDSLHNTTAAIPRLRAGLERAGLRL